MDRSEGNQGDRGGSGDSGSGTMNEEQRRVDREGGQPTSDGHGNQGKMGQDDQSGGDGDQSGNRGGQGGLSS